ncbi:MAG: hypothetical protein II718_00565 [Clostridiales bacterium]|nr:hypothetical protein [Clostridiales bacterium]
MNQEAKTTLTSRKNSNVYYLYEDKIIIETEKGTKELHMPEEETGLCFDTIYYIRDRLFAILAGNGRCDMRIEIDEDALEFTGSPIPTY